MIARPIAGRIEMKLQKMLTFAVATAALFALSQHAIAQNQDSQDGSQGPADSVTHGIAGQGGNDDATLEIAPQPGLVAPKPAVKEIPTDRNFNPGEDTSSIDPNFRPGTENGTGDSEGNLNSSLNRNFNNQPHARPYLGVTVAYGQCASGRRGARARGADGRSQRSCSEGGTACAIRNVWSRRGSPYIDGILPFGAILADKALSTTARWGRTAI